MTSLQNGNYNSRSMNGLTSIYANDITTDNITTIDATVSNNLTIGGNLSIPNFADVENTLTDYGQRLTGITYTAGTDTTNIDNNVNITKTLSLPSYTDVKTSLDTLFTRTTNQSWTSNNTTFATDYVKVGYTQANATPIFILGKTPNILNPSISTFVRNGLYFTSPTPVAPAVGIGMVSVIDQLWDCGVNVSNVGQRDSSKQGVQFRFDSRSTEKVFQIQTQEKVTNTVRIAIAALDNGHIDIEYRLNMLANANIQMSSGTGIISQAGTGTNALKATNFTGTVDVNGNITQSSANIISQTGTGTNALKATNFTGVVDVNGNITQSSANIISQAGTGTNALKATNFTGVVDVNGNITQSSANIISQTGTGTNALKSINVTGNIDFTGTLTNNGNPYVANAGTIQITSDNTNGNYYIPFTKTTASSSNSLFIDDTTTPLLTYNPNIGKLTTGAIALSGNLDISGNLTQTGNGNIISQTGTGVNLMKDITMNAGATLTQSTAGIISQTGTGTNAMKGITLNNDHLLTLQGVGRIAFPDGSVMRTYDEHAVTDCDMHDYLNAPKVAITSTFDIIYGNPALYSAATANVARFAAVKLKRGQIITGIGLICGNVANHYVALYQKGTTSARLAVSALTATTANVMTYIPFTASYTIPTTDIYYVSSLQTASNMSYYYNIPNNYLNYGPNTMTNGKLDKRAQSATLTGGVYPANIAAGQVFNFENFVFYYVIY